LIIYFGQRWYV